MWANQLWGISPEILRTLTVCIVAIEQTLHHHNYVEIKDQFQVYLGRCHGTFSPITQICTTHKTTPQQRKHCRSLTHEGKSESLLTSNKSVWIRSESKHIPAVIVKNLTQFLSKYTPLKEKKKATLVPLNNESGKMFWWQTFKNYGSDSKVHLAPHGLQLEVQTTCQVKATGSKSHHVSSHPDSIIK